MVTGGENRPVVEQAINNAPEFVLAPKQVELPEAQPESIQPASTEKPLSQTTNIETSTIATSPIEPAVIETAQPIDLSKHEKLINPTAVLPTNEAIIDLQDYLAKMMIDSEKEAA